jgi:uncharacterized protein (TIGR02217 family)
LLFSFVKTYGTVRPYTRRITKLNPGSVQVYGNGVPMLMDGTDVAVDGNAGNLVLVSPDVVGATWTADFEFHVPVRFNVQNMDAQMNSFSNRTWDSIKLVEIRV